MADPVRRASERARIVGRWCVLPQWVGSRPLEVWSCCAEVRRALTGLILRLYNRVIQALEWRNTIIPEADDDGGCAAFAEGLLAAATADPEWIEHEEHWTFASWAAYLAGKRDLIAPALLEKLDEDPDATSTLRRQMGAIVVTTNDTFLALRRRTIGVAKPVTSAPRVGRNDPCLCGSGTKYN